MMRRALIVLVLLADTTWAAQPPPRVRMDFAVTLGAMHLGDQHDVLEHDGKQYSVISDVKPVGVVALFFKNVHSESRGLVTKSGLRPLHFEENRTNKPKRAAEFDWEAKLIKLTDGDNVSTAELSDNTYDQTSFSYAFAFRSPDDELPQVHLTDGRRLSYYTYKRVGKEKIKTSIGELETVHFQKVREDDDKRGFEVWLAVGHHYLPVQIRFIEKDGKIFNSTVTAISYQ